MKQFKIFKHPTGTCEAVKQGWSWPAFFFVIIWAFLKKQWQLGIFVFTGIFLFAFLLYISIDEFDADIIINITSLIISVIFGLKGNSWREKNLSFRGYDFVDTITAANSDGAVALYLKSLTESQINSNKINND